MNWEALAHHKECKRGKTKWLPTLTSSTYCTLSAVPSKDVGVRGFAVGTAGGAIWGHGWLPCAICKETGPPPLDCVRINDRRQTKQGDAKRRKVLTRGYQRGRHSFVWSGFFFTQGIVLLRPVALRRPLV